MSESFSFFDVEDVVDRSQHVWGQLSGSRLFITGGTGFFGQWLLQSLCFANRRYNLNIKAIILTRDPESFRRYSRKLATDSAIELYKGDVRQFEFPKGYFSHIIHGATDTSQTMADKPFELIDVIVNGTRRVLEFAKLSSARRLLYLSSGAVYGVQPPEMASIPEDYLGACDPIKLHSSYGEAKRLAEHLCILTGQEAGVESVIVRGFAFVGPFLPLNAHFAIGNFIRDALYGDAIRIKGNGTTLRSYLYASDMAAWLWVMLVNGLSGRVYNLGSDKVTSITDLATLVANELAPEKAVRIEATHMDNAIRSRYIPSIVRARNELHLDVWTDLRAAIRRTGNWYRLFRQPINR